MERYNAARAALTALWVIACLIFLAFDAPNASAQVLYGSIVGTVTDQTNAVVPKASVKVTNTLTGLVREAVTDSAGYYSIPNLPEGSHDVTITGSGFKPVTQQSVAVRINTVTRADVSLQVGALTESVTVQASAAVLRQPKRT